MYKKRSSCEEQSLWELAVLQGVLSHLWNMWIALRENVATACVHASANPAQKISMSFIRPNDMLVKKACWTFGSYFRYLQYVLPARGVGLARFKDRFLDRHPFDAWINACPHTIQSCISPKLSQLCRPRFGD